MSRPPRLVERTLLATFLTVAVILLLTFGVLLLDTRDRARAAEIAKLEVTAHLFTELDARRQSDQLAIVGTLSETPTLKAALETYTSELRFGSIGPEQAVQLRQTVGNEIDKIADRARADVIAIVGTDGRPFAVAGGRRDRWNVDQRIEIDPAADSFQRVIVQPGGPFHVYGARLKFLDAREGLDQTVGVLLLASSLDANYAQDLSDLSHAGIVIVVDGKVAARTVAEPVARALAAHQGALNRTITLGGEEYAVGTLLDSGNARIYTLSSVEAAARTATSDALASLGTVAFGSFALAFIASVWLSRTVSQPIGRLASDIEKMSATKDFDRTIEPPRTSRELDSLANAFNDLVRALSAAEAETRSTYLGAIQALAAALDARDPYTAGHSERVSQLSVLIAQHVGLPEQQVEVIRLGALLHDIGKIGVPDEILRKPGPLTALEFEQIKRHPALGARILRQVPFLTPHLPIVELHHESPDGKGYPFGLRGEDIPLDARIVHVADAFDAMTSARAYRAARPASVALTELQRHAGTQFDADIVAALHAAMPSASALSEFRLPELVDRSA